MSDNPSTIPSFPVFRELQAQDQQYLSNIPNPFFISDYAWPLIWSWNVRTPAKISCFDNQYILQVVDALDGSLQYMLMGETTSDILTRLAQPDSPVHTLRWNPKPLSHPQWICKEDTMNADYVCPVAETLALSGGSTKKLRNKLQQFDRLQLPIHLVFLDSSLPETQSEMLQLSFQKHDIGSSLTLENEAFRHFLSHVADCSNMHLLGLTDDTHKLLAFSVLHRMNADYFIVLFLKSDLSISGLSQRMMLESFKFIEQSGGKMANLESDLGLENLRRSKSLYPSQRIAKFTFERTS